MEIGIVHVHGAFFRWHSLLLHALQLAVEVLEFLGEGVFLGERVKPLILIPADIIAVGAPFQALFFYARHSQKESGCGGEKRTG